MGDGFTHREHDLMCVQFAREERSKNLPRASGRRTGREQIRAARSVVFDQLIDAQTDVAKWVPVGW